MNLKQAIRRLVPPIALAGIIGATGCATLKKIDWPKKLECLPSTPELISLVGAALKDGDYAKKLEDLAFDHDAGAVLCAVEQITQDLRKESGANGVVNPAQLRGELFLAEVSAGER